MAQRTCPVRCSSPQLVSTVDYSVANRLELTSDANGTVHSKLMDCGAAVSRRVAFDPANHVEAFPQYADRHRAVRAPSSGSYSSLVLAHGENMLCAPTSFMFVSCSSHLGWHGPHDATDVDGQWITNMASTTSIVHVRAVVPHALGSYGVGCCSLRAFQPVVAPASACHLATTSPFDSVALLAACGARTTSEASAIN